MAVARVPAIMPHVSSSGGGDDLGSEDEVKVFKDEGEEEKRSSENLTEDKSDLIDLTESEVRNHHRLISLVFHCVFVFRSSICSSYKKKIYISSQKNIPGSRRTRALSACMCVAGKGHARRWDLCDDGKNVGEIRPQSRFR